MDELPRRAFCTLLAASAGTVSGCNTMGQKKRGPWRADGEERVVTTGSGLEAAFDNLAPGDTIRITAENAPYRTTEWLDVDVDGATIVGPNVDHLVVPAAGANVGGIRIGNNRRCRDVTVRGVGFHGNPDGQSDSAERLHGIVVRNARGVTIRGNVVRETHPEAHGDGGSGISVTDNCSDVWISDNRIRDFGDRGIQIAGDRIQVAGNVVTHGLDRPIACDLWYPDGRNHTANNVAIYGNLVGESVQGSLVGVARNTPQDIDTGYVSVFGNVGFGTHKSFCHVRGPEAIRSVSVRYNVSVQETEDLRTSETTTFSGVTVDPDAARNVSVEGNELYGYSGHGVEVQSDATTVTVRNNDIASPDLAGVRLVGCTGGVVGDNVVSDAGQAGIRLQESSRIAVRGNYVCDAGGVGIVTRGADGPAENDVAANHVVDSGREVDGRVPGILVGDAGVRVRDNAVFGGPGPAIAEADSAGRNRYEGNWAADNRGWHIRSPTSRVRDHSPPVGVHRGVSPADGKSVVEVEFDRPYADPPRLTFGRDGGGIGKRSFRTDADGNVVGVALTVSDAGGTVDVFVDDG